MDSLSIWHWILIALGLYLLYRVLRWMGLFVARVLKGTGQVAKTAGVIAAVSAIATGRAAADAVNNARKSALKKKLEELDKLHAQGTITSEELAAARSVALRKL